MALESEAAVGTGWPRRAVDPMNKAMPANGKQIRALTDDQRHQCLSPYWRGHVCRAVGGRGGLTFV